MCFIFYYSLYFYDIVYKYILKIYRIFKIKKKEGNIGFLEIDILI